MPTIGDVAARANVSTATVSRALNGKSTVDPELAKRVRTAAEELGYRPHGPARNLRRKTTATLTLVVTDIGDPFFAALARGLEDTARDRGYSLVLCDTDDDPAKERSYLDVALQERVAGVVIAPTSAATDVATLLDQGAIVVAVDRPLDEPRSDRVLVDTRAAAAKATTQLIDAGYRRIGFLGCRPDGYPDQQRLAGYQDALGQAADEHLVRHAAPHADAATSAVRDLLAPPASADALLIASPQLAPDALGAVTEHGLSLGTEFGVVAFDVTAWATALRPALSVVSQPAYEIGAAAGRHIVARLAGETSTPKHTELSPEFVVRGSSLRDQG
ncbi:LacI family DNA-binding transcriptional regulator [Haloechinothrix halophila]|uniref:LacI family DNA-binding transcriptional regulator n=1 Tax=Haloechinothrix halophila TaxID=1069073 RepID=UPI000408E822|nr:LacI family DNA-binding transcriptional regulator [Haloechinothrix halophila]